MNLSRSIMGSPRVVSFAVGAAALGVYAATLAPGLNFIDSGELAAVATTLGIAHPTGYPLFTMIGFLFAHLPLASEPIVRLNFMAAVFCASGVVVFVRLIFFLLDRYDVVRGERWHHTLAAATAGLLLAFSETYWGQATSVEVYSLHVFLVISVLYSFLLAHESARSSQWMLFAFLVGLSFTNHMTTILLAPGLLYYYFARQGFSQSSWRRILSLTLPFLLALSLYLYLPLRASENPPMNWGNPVTLERFLWHWSGEQYRSWIFSSMAVAGKQFSYFLSSYPAEFAFTGGALALVGMVALWFANRKLWMLSVLLFAGCVAYSINYDIHDIDSYFLLAYIVTALWAGWGANRVIFWLSRSWRLPGIVIVFLGLAAGMVPLSVHYSRENEHDNHLVEDYARNMFASFDSNAVVFSFQWDYWVSAANYLQLVRGIRPDVVVIDKELLRRSWYYHQLEERSPWLIARSRTEVEAFLREADKFEHGRPYNPLVIEARYTAVIRSFIEASMADHPVYVGPEVEVQYTAGLQRVPQGLAFRLYADTLYHPTNEPVFFYRPLDRTGRWEDQVRKMYADAWLSRGDYYFGKAGDRKEAIHDYEEAYRFEPGEGLIARRLAFLRSDKMR
ncbi:MAG: DUF2723 domain-containing protein [Bacteroidota bacterium]